MTVCLSLTILVVVRVNFREEVDCIVRAYTIDRGSLVERTMLK